MTRTTLADVQASADGEIGRADGKAQTLTATAGTMLTLGASVMVVATLPIPVRVGGWTAVGMVALALGAALLALRPRLRGGFGFMRWAAMTPAQLLEDLAAPDTDERAAAVAIRKSRLARRKNRLTRLAHDLLLASPAIAVLAGLITRLL